MKDSTILKIAIALGVGVFIWQLVTLKPTNLNSPGANIALDPWTYVDSSTEVVLEDPHSIQGWRELATALYRAGDPESSLQEWLENAPSLLVDSYGAEGILRYWFGRWIPTQGSNVDQGLTQAAAREQFLKAIERLQAFIGAGQGEILVDHYCLLGRSQYFAGEVEASRQTLKIAERKLDADPDAFDPGGMANRHTWVALIWADMGEQDLAAARWDRVWEIIETDGQQTLDVAWPTTWFELAVHYSEIERWSRAEEAALKRKPVLNASGVRTDLPDTWHKVGWRLQSQRHPKQAKQAWINAMEAQARVVESDNLNFRHWYNLACFRALSGDQEGAIDAFETCVDMGWKDHAKARYDDDLRSLQGDPRFRAAMDRIVPEEELGVDRGPSGLRPPAPRGRGG